MADKFLNTGGSGTVDLSNGTVNIIAAELGAVNLTPSKPVKTNATKQLISGNLDISDVNNLQSELNTKTELSFTESDAARVNPATGELKLYAKTDKRLYKLNDAGDEKQLGNVYSTAASTNNHLAVWQGGSGDHIQNSAIHYNNATEGLEHVSSIKKDASQILLSNTSVDVVSTQVNIKGPTDFFTNSIANVTTLNGTAVTDLLVADGSVPMAGPYNPSAAQDIATKSYVDNHSTSGNYVRTDGTSTMTGNLQMGVNNINGADQVSLNVINKQGTQNNITVNTNPYFDISGGDFGSVLRLIADVSNINNDAGEIHYYQDGLTLSGGVLMDGAAKTMNVVSCGHSAGGINLKVGALTDTVYTAPTRLSVDYAGHTIAHRSLKITGDDGTGPGNYGKKQLFLRHPNDDYAGWWQGCQNSNPNTSDNDYYFSVIYTDQSTHTAGYIQDSVNTTPPAQMNFTGQHRTFTMETYSDDMIGKLFCSTGRYMNYLKPGEECTTQKCITINDAHPIVEECSEIKSKRVFGVCSGLEPLKRVFDGGSFQSLYDKESSDNRLMLNSLGEGSILVIDGQTYENGDLLESYYCYATRQDGSAILNTTVAKITCDIDFDNIPMENVRIFTGTDEKTNQPVFEDVLNPDGTVKTQPKFDVKTVTLQGTQRRVALVGCVYI